MDPANRPMTALLPDPPPSLVSRFDVPTPRYTSYPTAPEFGPEIGPAAYAEALERAAADVAAPLSAYVHLPFCHQLCTFCGCNVIVSRDFRRTDTYLPYVERELDLVAERLGARRTLSQVHWGGGTPTFLDEPRLERLWRALTDRFTVLPDAEVALEVHPGFTTVSQLRTLRDLGFNRLSMGVQDLDPRVLDAIGREQTEAQVRTLVAEARALGFGAINLDLVYGLPHQQPDNWQRTLEGILELRPDRLAVYAFAFLPTMRPQQRKLQAEPMASGHAKLGLFLQASRAFLGAGYRPIGMDHFAAPDDPLAHAEQAGCLGRNFQGYTVQAAPETVAFGVTGIGDVGGLYAQNVKSLTAYAGMLDTGQLPVERGVRLSPEDHWRRAAINELMCNLRLRLEPDAAEGLHIERATLRPLATDGLIELDETDGALDIRVTPLGRLFVRNVASAFDSRLRARRGDAPTFSRAV